MGNINIDKSIINNVKYLYCECGLGIPKIADVFATTEGLDIDKAIIGKIIKDNNFKKGIIFSDKERILITELSASRVTTNKILKEVHKINPYRKLVHLYDYIKENNIQRGEVWSDEEEALLKEYYPKGGYKLCKEKGLSKSLIEVRTKVKTFNIKAGKIAKRWTEEEKDYVLSNLGILSASDMAKHLGRTPESVSQWLKVRGLLKSNSWTIEEDKILKKYYLKGGSNLCQEKGLKRDSNCIRQRAIKFGYKINNRWTLEEDNILKDYYVIGGYSLCIKKGLSNRSVGAIHRRAHSLGLVSGTKEKKVSEWDLWSDAEIEILKEYYPLGGSSLCVAKGLNRGRSSIVTKAYQQGLRLIEGRGWGEEDIRLLKKYYPTEGVKGCKVRGLKYANSSIRVKASELGIKYIGKKSDK